MESFSLMAVSVKFLVLQSLRRIYGFASKSKGTRTLFRSFNALEFSRQAARETLGKSRA